MRIERSMSQDISHIGIVESTDGQLVRVRVEQSSACSSCAAARYCRSGERQERIIEAVAEGKGCQTGDEVIVSGSMRQSRFAVMVAYIVPLALLMGVLLAVTLLGGSEGLAAVSSLAVVAAYYAVMACFRKRMAREFQFRVTKKN